VLGVVEVDLASEVSGLAELSAFLEDDMPDGDR
jgi:hypothetical protein